MMQPKAREEFEKVLKVWELPKCGLREYSIIKCIRRMYEYPNGVVSWEPE